MRLLMGTELMRICVKEDNDDFPSVPPGFESYTSFALKRVEDNEKQNDKNMTSCSASTSASESQSTQVENDVQVRDTTKVARSLRRRPWINYGRYENSSEEDSDCERLDQNFSSRPCLPKGVIRGCPDCNNCQKVVARWQPEDALRPNLEDAPVFYPTEEEFQDTLKYISSIRARAEPYGICRIVPPSSWKPPCPLKEKSRKMSRIQSNMKRKRKSCTRMGVDNGTRTGPNAVFCEAERFGFEPGPEFTLETFQRYADDFKAKYFRNENVSHLSANTTILNGTSEPSVENIEGEYWRMVENPTEEIEVLYGGADLETGVFGSGFPSKFSHVGSASHEHSMVVYRNVLFLFCWHVEDHHLYSLNYMHWGAPKMWYGVPGKDACKLEEAMRKHLPELFEEQPDLLHKLVTQLSPSILKSKGVPVYRCVQNPGEFVLTFPRAYHSGFNCGFNCAEAVNVAPVDWLPHGHIAIELYREQGRKTSISHDKLLLGAAREAVRAQWELNLLKKNTTGNLQWKDVCGKDGLLAKALKTRVDMERVRREFLCSSSQALKMESGFDATSERECNICFFDLHLSAAGCRCSPDRYACLDHAKQICSCSWNSKFFLFRYDISELNILVEALEGKLSAIYRWAKLDLGLALTSYVSADKEKVLKELKLHSSNLSHSSRANLIDVPIEDQANSANSVDISYLQQRKSTEAGSPLNHMKELLTFNSSKPTCEMANHKICVNKEEPVICRSKPRTSGCQLSQEDSSYALSQPLAQHGDAVVMGKKDTITLPREDNSLDSTQLLHVKQECHEQRGPVLASTPVDLSFHIGLTSAESVRNIPASSTVETSDHRSESLDICPLKPQHSGTSKVKNEDNHEKFGGCTTSNVADGARAVNGNISCSLNNYRHKGPRIAKVVRRINCNVEPLEFGVVLSGKSWCSSQAIYPKGFRSRVRYINVLDPSSMCYYISEILDAGRGWPLFMVSLENCPNEVFIHMSATRCWELVRERVNQEIAKQHKLGRKGLPPLQPPGSLDGFEMFGFSSPAIVQAIEALDQSRVCNEYWDSRPYSRPQGQISQAYQQTNVNGGNGQGALMNQHTPVGVVAVLRSLFKKVNAEELKSLYSILSDNKLAADRILIAQLLNEEIHKSQPP
ncbi:Zinc finger, C5HC2-type [Sesbania bispinosa]|nr:Zinc finger, C5HC2-type [Sesbania bispinosa]